MPENTRKFSAIKAKTLTPEQILELEKTTVVAYNRAPASFSHRWQDGSLTELVPGGSAEVPKYVAEKWAKVSNGRCGINANEAAPSDLRSQLTVEQARTSALQAQLEKALSEVASLKKTNPAKG